MGGSDGAAATPPGTLALTRFETVAARSVLLRPAPPAAPQTWRSLAPDERFRWSLRDAAWHAAAGTAVIVGATVLWDGWSETLLLVFPALFGLLLWMGGREPELPPDLGMLHLEVTVTPDRLRVAEDGATRIDSPWHEVAVWGFAEWQPRSVPGRPLPPEVRQLRLSGPDGRALPIDTFMFRDRAAVDAMTWHLCRHRRLLLDEREWVIRD